VIEALRREVAAQQLTEQVQVTVCSSLGLCERGPNMVVYPEGVWYSGIKPEDIPQIIRSHFIEGRPVERLVNADAGALAAEIRGNRDKMLAAQRAKEAVGALPEELLQTARSFTESRVFLTAIELDVFTAVGSGSTAPEVAHRIAADPRATEMLLNALVAMGLLSKQEQMFSNTPTTARYFVKGSRDDARTALMHTVHLWRRWSTLTDCVRAGTAVAYEEMEARGADWTQAFIAAMHRGALERATAVVEAVGVEGVERMLDVGGGSAAYSIAFSRASEKLHADVLDLPNVVPIAQNHIREAGLADRIRTRVGDLRQDTLGREYDLVFVSAICHMLSPEENQDLVRRCAEALRPRGRLVIQDFILESDRTSPKTAALFALNMLVGTRAGNSYSKEEYTAWLERAGLRDVRHIRLPGATGLIVGTRP